MSGHSKFANIKHKKEKNDAAKGKMFTIIGKEIAVAVKEGGADPDNNSKLRDVIAKAKANNMPNDTIERGIKKAAGNVNAVNYESVTYEGYGPNGTAIIVDALTDKKGQIIIDKEECDMEADELMMIALDAGAEDFSDEEECYEVLTQPEEFSAVREALEAAGVKMTEAEVTMIPQNYVTLTDEESIKKMNRIIDLLDEDDDVQEVFHNWDE